MQVKRTRRVRRVRRRVEGIMLESQMSAVSDSSDRESSSPVFVRKLWGYIGNERSLIQ